VAGRRSPVTDIREILRRLQLARRSRCWSTMKGSKRKPTPGSESPAGDVPDLPERWSAARKTESVLRLLRGEALDAVSRESQVPAHELESWKRVFLEQGTRAGDEAGAQDAA